VSDSRTLETDPSGGVLVERMTATAITWPIARSLPDDAARIAGGRGGGQYRRYWRTGRDVTPEALEGA
jgi:hypothetical protein